MTRRLLEIQSNLAGHLHGLRCSQVSTAGIDSLVIDFGELERTSSGELSGSLHLLLDCPWRIESVDEVICGWEDVEEEILRLASLLIDGTVTATEVRRPGFDLTVTFSHGLELKVFPDCRAYYLDDLAGEALPWLIGGDGVTAGSWDLSLPEG